MATAKQAATRNISDSIEIIQIKRGKMEVCILGTSPLIYNAMSAKVKMGILFPQPKKNAAVKASTVKHNPLQEYRDSVYRMRVQKNPPTELALLPTMFKQAMCTAALRTPNVRKTEIEQLITVPWDNIPLYGVPMLHMSVVRSADMNRTPDVRTRAIVPEWATTITLDYATPNLREGELLNLLANAGVISGVCDYRQEKGAGSFGAFKPCSPNDPNFMRITSKMRKDEQLAALETPVCYDHEAEELLAYFNAELRRRDMKLAA
jgi:hypothetical protein